MISKYFELFESNKKTYLSAAIDVLSNSENPLTVEEICFEINKQRDIFIPKSSFRSLLSTLISYSKGKEELSTTKQRNKRGTILFEITEDNPQKFKLISNVKFEEKMTFIDASQLILKQNDNRPMSAREIWDEIEEQDLVETSGATPWDTLNVEMLKYSDNSKISEKRKNSLFHVVTDNPAMFILINPKQEVQPTSEDDTEILKPKKYYLLGAYGKENPNIWRDYVSGGYWLNGFGAKTISEWQNKTGDEIFNFKDNVMNIPVGSSVAIKSTYTREKVKPAMMIKARGVVTKNYFDGIRLDVKWDSDFEPFEIMRNDVGRYQSTLHEVTSKEHIDLIWNDLALPIKQSAFSLPDDEVLPFSHFRASQAQEERDSKSYNPVSKTDKINPVYLTTQPIINEPEIKKFGYIYSTASSVVKQEVSKVSNIFVQLSDGRKFLGDAKYKKDPSDANYDKEFYLYNDAQENQYPMVIFALPESGNIDQTIVPRNGFRRSPKGDGTFRELLIITVSVKDVIDDALNSGSKVLTKSIELIDKYTRKESWRNR